MSSFSIDVKTIVSSYTVDRFPTFTMNVQERTMKSRHHTLD